MPQVSRLRPGILLVKAYSVPFCYFRLVGRVELVSWVYNYCYITAE